jgi:hypothetical protein
VRENPISCIALFVVQSAAAGPYTYSAVKKLVNYKASPLANSALPTKTSENAPATTIHCAAITHYFWRNHGLTPLQSQMNLGVTTAD